MTLPAKLDKFLSGIIGRLVLASLISLVLAPITSDPDMGVWYIVAKNISNGLNPYSSKYFTYPPVWAYISYAVTFYPKRFFGNPTFAESQSSLGQYHIYDGAFTPSAFVTTPLFNFLIKLPLIAADILVGYLIYRYLKRYLGEKRAIIGSSIWLFNPLLIICSAICGQFDVLASLCAFIAVLLFIEQSYLYSGIMLSIGTFLKIWPLYLVLLFSGLLILNLVKPWKGTNQRFNIRAKGFISFISSFLIFSLLLLLPLLVKGSIGSLFYTNSLRVSEYAGAGGATIFNLIYAPAIGQIVNNFLYQDAGILPNLLLYGTFAAVICLILWTWRRIPIKSDVIMILSLMTISISLLSPYTVNPQYIVWLLPFAIVVLISSRAGIFATLSLSVLMTVFLLIWNYPFTPLATFASSMSAVALNGSQMYTNFVDKFLFPDVAFATGILSAIILYWFMYESVRRLTKCCDQPQR